MSRLSRLFLAAALAFPCLAAYGQQGDPAFQCFRVEDEEAGLASLRAQGVNVQMLTGDAAQRFVALLNALEPVTEYKAERVLVLINGEVGAMALISGDVACAFRAPMPVDLLKLWIRTARGIDA